MVRRIHTIIGLKIRATGHLFPVCHTPPQFGGDSLTSRRILVGTGFVELTNGEKKLASSHGNLHVGCKNQASYF